METNHLLRATLFFLPLFLAARAVHPYFDDPSGNPLGIPGFTGMIAGVAEGYAGEWELVSASSGVSAMHMVITHTNKAIMFDATNFGKTKVPLAANNCRTDAKTQKLDCTAHAVEYDIETGKIRPLKVLLVVSVGWIFPCL